MFGKRCTLCGGKLNSNGICTECGLDNTKSDKNYKLNQSECNHEPLTHVHHEKPTVTRQQGQTRQSQARQSQARQSQTWQNRATTDSENKGRKMAGKKKSAGKIISKVIAVIVILNVIIGILQPLWDSILSDGIDSFTESNEDYTRSDPYKDLTEDLPPEGESVNYELTSGDYIVGVHIPVGNYTAETTYDYDTVQVDDWDHNIYLYEYAGRTDGDYLDDLRFYNGAHVRISSTSTVTLHSENAQTQYISYQENPLKGGAAVTLKGDATVGADIPEGVYDVAVISGEGSIEIDIYLEDGDYNETLDLYLGENSIDGTKYQNLVLPKDAQITLDGDLKLRLTPSEKISTTDYLEYYNY